MGCPRCGAPQGCAPQRGRACYGVRFRFRAPLRYAPLPMVAPSASLTRLEFSEQTNSSRTITGVPVIIVLFAPAPQAQ
ncbi:MAG: hypothetical protein RML37_11765, partial [Chitinophagales bacterium]|nr:hypothetical protein [Chitinophagales bacterium]